MDRMIRPIVLHPDARLKKKSVEVEGITDALIELAEDMMETMYHAPGIGLAAPQIGVLQRVIVMDCAKKEDEEQKCCESFDNSSEEEVLHKGCEYINQCDHN